MSFITRIQNKRDTASNWEKNNPVLLAGELIIVDTNAGNVRFKIGDGTKTYTQLPFQDEAVYNSLSGKAAVDHDHDGVYCTEDSVDAKLESWDDYVVATDENTIVSEIGETFGGHTPDEFALKSETADAVHVHDDLYYTETEIDSFISSINANVNNIAATYETKEDASSKLSDAKAYTDAEIANLVNSAPETLDTLGELAGAFNENQEVVDVLNQAITTKYSADNPPPYPVTSVQGKTGDVSFTTETWTFTLANGTTVTKKVMLG